MQGHINNLLGQIKELRGQQESNRQLITTLQQQISAFMNLMEDHDDRITALENRMTAAEEDLEELTDQLGDLLKAIDGLEVIDARLDQMQTDITDFNRQELVDAIEELEEMLEDLREEFEGLDFLEQSDLEPILEKILLLELALEGIDISLEDSYLMAEVELIIGEMLETVLPVKLTVLTTRISSIEMEMQDLLDNLEDIVLEMEGLLERPTQSRGRNSDLLMYLGISALALGIVAMVVGMCIVIVAGKKPKSVTGGGIAWEAGE